MMLFIKVCIAVFLMFAVVKVYQKAKEVQKKYTLNLVVFSKVWLFFAALLIVCYLGLLKVSAKEIMIDIVLIALIIFLLVLGVTFCRWHIDIENDRIEYCPLLGKGKCRYYDQITRAEIDEKNKIWLFSEDKDILKISSGMGSTYLIAILKGHNIRVEYRSKIDDFIMGLPLFYPVMHLCFFIIAVIFSVFSVKYYITAGLLWFVLALGSAYNCVSGFKDKVIVKGNVIVQTRFLRKVKKIEYGQVDKVMRKTRDNAPYLYIYSCKGVKMKINMLCGNKELLEEVINRHRWEK